MTICHRLTITVLLAFCALVCTAPVLANGQASRSPINAAGDSEAESVDDGSIIDFNPNRDVVSTDAGYDAISSIRVDTTTGVIGGYVDYALDAARTYADLDEVGGSSAGGGLTLNTALVGAAGPGTIDVTIEMAFDGSFFISDGTPSLILSADLALTTFNPAAPLDGTIYQSNLNFLSNALTSGNVDTVFGSSVAPLGGGAMDYPGATAEIISATQGNLDAILRLTAPVTVGDTLILTGFVLGGATASPDPNDTDISDGIDVLAAAGGVDFSNTAALSILLPAGYSLAGADPLIANVVSAVPLPAASGLFGIAAIALTARRRRAVA